MMATVIDGISYLCAQILVLMVTGIMLFVLGVLVDYAGAAVVVGHTGWLIPTLAH